MNILIIRIAAAIGLALSTYALYIEKKVATRPSYAALCDINDRISCTKAFSSAYGKIFGISNSRIGIVAYAGVIAASILAPALLLPMAIAAVLSSIALAFFSYVKMRTYCIICTSIYLVNISFLIAAI